jgi:hypothetical protein
LLLIIINHTLILLEFKSNCWNTQFKPFLVYLIWIYRKVALYQYKPGI